MAESNRRRCNGCSRMVGFFKDEKGTKQILDMVAPVWLADEETGECRRSWGRYVTHYATCPKAGTFGKGPRAALVRRLDALEQVAIKANQMVSGELMLDATITRPARIEALKRVLTKAREVYRGTEIDDEVGRSGDEPDGGACGQPAEGDRVGEGGDGELRLVDG